MRSYWQFPKYFIPKTNRKVESERKEMWNISNTVIIKKTASGPKEQPVEILQLVNAIVCKVKQRRCQPNDFVQAALGKVTAHVKIMATRQR